MTAVLCVPSAALSRWDYAWVLEKLIVGHVLKKFPAFYGCKRFSTARHWFLSLAKADKIVTYRTDIYSNARFFERHGKYHYLSSNSSYAFSKFTSLSSLLLYSAVRLIVIHSPFFPTSPSQAFASIPLHYPVPTFICFSCIPVTSLSFVHYIISSYRSIGSFGPLWYWQKFAVYFLSLVVTGVPEQTKLGGLVDSTSVGGLSFLPGYGAASVFNNRNKVLVEIPKKVSCWTFDCKKKKNYKKLYTVLSCLGVFTFCTCCKILICVVCIAARFKLPCV